jgi:hypothetical protein
MSAIKYFFVSILICASCTAFSQNNDPVFLRWKLNPGETITYKTVMEEIDTANHKDFAMDGLSKSFGNDANDADFKKMVKQLNKLTSQSDFVTYLKKNRKNVIDIEMKLGNTATTGAVTDTSKVGRELKDMHAMMVKMTGGVVLRGAIYEDGTIESFYTKNDQKNLISTFFELPGKPVKVGDTWSPDIHFLSMDQNFICDSSYKKNNVTVISIDKKENEHIVTLRYDIEEYVSGNFTSPFDGKPIKTSMKMTHRALAEFSIEKGRWSTYNGIMSLSSTGIMTSQSTKRCSLIIQ